MYIDLFGSSDRLGGNIVDMISQILYSVKNGIYIKYDSRESIRVYNSYNQEYNKSIFVQTLFDIIDKHNSTIFDEDFSEYLDLASPTHFETLSRSTLSLKADLVSEFKKIFTDDLRELFNNRAKESNYTIPFDKDETILVHLRLEDVKNRPDYDGSLCANHFSEKINKDEITNSITNEEVQRINPNCNMQSPIPLERINSIINSIKEKNPNKEVIFITSPGESLDNIPYRILSSEEESYDLFLLCNTKNLILSRSNYALTSLFFGIGENVHVPLWGHLPCYGLYTKYDKNNFNYFS